MDLSYFPANIFLNTSVERQITSISLAEISLDTSILLACVFLLKKPLIVLETIGNTMGRYTRVIVALLMSPPLSRMLNARAMALFTGVHTFDAQMYL